jgi:putative salt-induced outer membrane protein YdiY
MNRLTLPVLLLFALSAFGQDNDPAREKRFQEEAARGQDTTKPRGWVMGSVAGLNLSQVSFKDWAQGGENSMAYAIWATGNAVRNGEATRWINNLKATFGQTRVGDQELRKTDDELYYESLLIYTLGTTINPYGSFTLRTQFAPGYHYPANLPKQQISAFFDPAYLTQSAGVAYTPFANLTTRFGVGVREVITSTYTAYADDPGTVEIEKTRVDGGLESVTDFKWPFAENMVFTSRLEMFAPFTMLDRVIVRCDNTVAMKVNQYVTVNFNVQLINDANVTARTQMKEALAVGLSYTLL